MYQSGTRYYLDLFGATHMEPYSGTNPAERLVALVTVDFFDRYVLGQNDATAKMTHEVTGSGTASFRQTQRDGASDCHIALTCENQA